MPEAKLLLVIRNSGAVLNWCLENGVKVYSVRNHRFKYWIELIAALEKP